MQRGRQFGQQQIQVGSSFKDRPGDVQGSLFTTRGVGERNVASQPKAMFHASDRDFKPGEVIRPASAVSGAKSQSLLPDRAFAAGDRRVTDYYAGARGGKTFKVEPVGGLKEFSAPAFAQSTLSGHKQYTADAYRVVGEAGPSRAPRQQAASPHRARAAEARTWRTHLQANPEDSGARSAARRLINPRQFPTQQTLI